MHTTQARHPLRPSSEPEATLWDLAATVPDPEIPVISIADLGILRSTRLVDGVAIVDITPTYSGCPAVDHIAADITEALRGAGYEHVTVNRVLTPAWSTDWITEEGRQALKEYGIAPPEGTAARAGSGPVPLSLAPPPPIECPHCGSRKTTKLAHFGSTSCKALYACRSCFEPFDYFKVH